jgi:hypothetical protein
MQFIRDEFRLTVTVSAGIIIASFFSSAILVSWFSGDIGALARGIEKRRSFLRERTVLLETFAQFKGAGPVIERYEERLRALLPSQEELLDFPRYLESVARVHQVALNFGFQGDPVLAGGSEPGGVSFSLQVSGTPQRVARFLREVERESPRFVVRFSSFEVAQGGPAEEWVLVQGTLFFR